MLLVLIIVTLLVAQTEAFHGTRFSFTQKRISTASPHSSSSSRFGVPTLEPSDLERVISATKYSKMPLIVEYSKEKCTPCKKIKPEFDAMSEEYGDWVTFYKLDADSSKEALKLMKIQGIRYSNCNFIFVCSSIDIDTIPTIPNGPFPSYYFTSQERTHFPCVLQR
jgi:thiol-disulfide isomerase/thioredoxin